MSAPAYVGHTARFRLITSDVARRVLLNDGKQERFVLNLIGLEVIAVSAGQ